MFDANDGTEGKFLHTESGVVVTGCQSRSKRQSVNQSAIIQLQAVRIGQNDNQSINQSAIIQSQTVRVGQNDNQSAIIVTGCWSRSKRQSFSQLVNQSAIIQSQAVGVGQNDNQSINQQSYCHRLSEYVKTAISQSNNRPSYNHRLSE